ncbi:DUF1302 domain-containing protein [Neisseriaceae bacterium JH1-16]|nr:DUF1302 domain-containing protein [Neisseriaceae bacterium JH1-16]
MREQQYRAVSRATARCFTPALFIGALALTSHAEAGQLTLGQDQDTTITYAGTLSYGLGVRAKNASDTLINSSTVTPSGQFANINMDDGDRNFKKGSLINNRVSLLAEADVRHDNYGVFVRGNAFYDQAYRRGHNDNDSPATINKFGPSNEFSDGASYYEGRRARLLDAYLYGNFKFGESKSLDLRAGNQVVAWGESLFFPGISGAQGPVDATKANVPGVEVKDILLPVGQVSAQLAVNETWSLLGYYQYQYKPNELDAVGSYFSYSDLVGPGAAFSRLSPGTFSPFGFALPPASPNIMGNGFPFTGENKARNSGQWGVGTRFRVGQATELGLFYLRYHDKNPSVAVNFTPTPAMFQSMGFPALMPTSYDVNYLEDIKLAGASFTTRLGDTNVAGEVSYKQDVPMLVGTPLGAMTSRGDATQAQLSFIQSIGPTPLANSISLLGEVVDVYVNKVKSLSVAALGGASFDHLVNDETTLRTRNAWGYQFGATLTYNNVFDGWDLDVPLTFGQLVKGVPAVAGALGSYTGEGDMRLGVGANFKYLNNLQLGLSYNAFLGSPDRRLRPLADRDYWALSAKYSF